MSLAPEHVYTEKHLMKTHKNYIKQDPWPQIYLQGSVDYIGLGTCAKLISLSSY